MGRALKLPKLSKNLRLKVSGGELKAINVFGDNHSQNI